MQKYDLIISILILISSFALMMISYERKKPQAREIVMISVMSAFTVVANLICAYTVPLHAGTAMVIITGIALGPQAGFMVGALSRFICNFFMTQGIWTPWEMLAWGILGALGGILFSKIEIIGLLADKEKYKRSAGKAGMQSCIVPLICILACEIGGYILYLFKADTSESFWGWRLYIFGFIGIVTACIFKKNKLPANFITMSIFTFFSVFFIYGGIMNFAAFTMTQNSLNEGVAALKMLYITGIPYDALHALGATVCIFFMGESIVRKIERVRIKYGMLRTQHN